MIVSLRGLRGIAAGGGRDHPRRRRAAAELHRQLVIAEGEGLRQGEQPSGMGGALQPRLRQAREVRHLGPPLAALEVEVVGHRAARRAGAQLDRRRVAVPGHHHWLDQPAPQLVAPFAQRLRHVGERLDGRPQGLQDGEERFGGRLDVAAHRVSIRGLDAVQPGQLEQLFTFVRQAHSLSLSIQDLADPLQRDAHPVRTVVELIPQLVYRLLEQEGVEQDLPLLRGRRQELRPRTRFR